MAVEAAWAAYRADLQVQVAAGTLSEAEGKERSSERRKAAWVRAFLLTHCDMKF
ncbi:hypothetical protein DGo_PB0355 (plasmid) [Deinococcus gobiensis I-0]|uniref:Uncharacterized protein n=1 Tax=Deinococcus gobiensis (strain DSM 21396 / JCM 16679 / CGMCC 1.7299 / I-0) TaxID=745776 RepID=H8H277_DEIGI|nr:hypothetical protein DGo_PB0355 [Deinococcus gobiensis I-0]